MRERFGGLAQLVEHGIENAGVPGSSPGVAIELKMIIEAVPYPGRRIFYPSSKGKPPRSLDGAAITPHFSTRSLCSRHELKVQAAAKNCSSSPRTLQTSNPAIG